MVSSEENQTTIAISRKNHQELSNRGKKGQSFDEILTEVLCMATEYMQENKRLRQPKTRAGHSVALAARVPGKQTAFEGDLQS